VFPLSFPNRAHFASEPLLVRGLAGGIPRAFQSHRTANGALYGRFLRGVLQRLGPLPADATPTLKELGRLVVDLDRLDKDLQAALAKPDSKEARAIRSQRYQAHKQLRSLSRSVERMVLGGPRKLDLAQRLASSGARRP
jgi:hypothetical protein